MRLLLTLLPTMALVIYGQLMVKWRVGSLSGGETAAGPLGRLMNYLLDPLILSSYAAALAASVTWMFVVERYPVSLAFPIHIGLTVALVVLGGVFLLGETMTPSRVLGIATIVIGVAIVSRS